MCLTVPTNYLGLNHLFTVYHISMFSSTIIIPSTLSGSAGRPLNVDKHARHKSSSPGRHEYPPIRSHRDYSPDYYSTEPKKSRYPKLDSVAPHSRSRYPEHHIVTEGGRSRHADPYPEHLSRGKHGDIYPEYESAHTDRARDQAGRDTDRVVRRKERPARPPPPQSPKKRDKAWDRERQRQGRDWDWERQVRKDQRRDREMDLRLPEGWEKSRDRGHSEDRYGERDKRRQKDKDKQRARARSRDRGLDEDFLETKQSRDWPMDSRATWDKEDDDSKRRARSRQRSHSSPNEVFDEFKSDEGHRNSREFWDPQQGEGPEIEHSHSHPNKETGTTLRTPWGSAGVYVWCAGVALVVNLRWWVDLTSL